MRNDLIEHLKTLVQFGEKANMNQVFISLVTLNELIRVLSETPEPGVRDGELINRNDVIRMFNGMDRYRTDKLILQDTDREFPGNEVFVVDDCYELLENIHTVSTERTGKWVATGYKEENWAELYECTACGHKEYYANYCPHCGSKMLGEKQNDDSETEDQSVQM